MVEAMHTAGHDVTIFFYNPNIHPRKEYEIRKHENKRYADEISKEVKKLGKKLRQIEELEARAAAGEELNADQQGKISSKQKVEEEFKKMEELAGKLTL